MFLIIYFDAHMGGAHLFLQLYIYSLYPIIHFEPPPNIWIVLEEKKILTPAQRWLRKPSTGNSQHVLSPKIGPLETECFWGYSTTTIVWTPHTGSLTWKVSLWPSGRGALPLPRGLMGIPCYTFAIWGSRHGLPDGTFQPLSCRSWYPGNLEEFCHDFYLESRKALWAKPLQSPYFAFWSDSSYLQS